MYLQAHGHGSDAVLLVRRMRDGWVRAVKNALAARHPAIAEHAREGVPGVVHSHSAQLQLWRCHATGDTWMLPASARTVAHYQRVRYLVGRRS